MKKKIKLQQQEDGSYYAVKQTNDTSIEDIADKINLDDIVIIDVPPQEHDKEFWARKLGWFLEEDFLMTIVYMYNDLTLDDLFQTQEEEKLEVIGVLNEHLITQFKMNWNKSDLKTFLAYSDMINSDKCTYLKRLVELMANKKGYSRYVNEFYSKLNKEIIALGEMYKGVYDNE